MSSRTVHPAVLPSRGKLDDLELVRGLAAFSVVIYHFLCGYVPAQSASAFARLLEIVPEPPVLIAPVNGRYMVAVFFVLSSFVLTVKLVHSSDWRAGLVGILKRFPRLLPLTLLGTLLPAALFLAGLMANREAAVLTGSSWLPGSGGVKLSGGWPDPSFYTAVRDAFVLFDRGVSQFNSALWTMRYELIGSISAIASAMIVGAERRAWIDGAVLAVLAFAALAIHPLVSTCIVTVWVTKYVVLNGRRFGRTTALGLVLAGLALGSHYEVVPEDGRQILGFSGYTLNWIIYGVGAMLLFVGVRNLGGLPLQNHAVGRQLGRLSFPVYVLHIPVQASLGAAIVLALGTGTVGLLTALLVSTAVVYLLAIPVAGFDTWWVRQLSTAGRRVASGRLVPRTVSDPAP